MTVEIEVGPDDDSGTIDSTTPAAPPLPAPPAAAPAQPAEDQQSQIERLQAAVKRNNAENAKHRSTAKTMKRLGIDDFDQWLSDRGIDPATGLPAPSGPPDSGPEYDEDEYDEDDGEGEGDEEEEPEVEEPEEQPESEEQPATPPPARDPNRKALLEAEKRITATQAENGVLRQALIDAALNEALRAARFSGTVDKATRIMDLASIQVDANGGVTGAQEAVRALREEIPEWFTAGRPTQSAQARGPIDGGERRAAPPRPLTWEQQAANRMTGRRGRG